MQSDCSQLSKGTRQFHLGAALVPDVSVIIPAYNEENSVGEVLGRLSKVAWHSCRIETIVVDDGSTDNTPNAVKAFPFVTYIRHHTNLGKGAAIRTGIQRSRGKVILIQDADLEYPPEHLPQLVKPVLAGEVDVVFGSRFKGKCQGMSFSHFVGNKLLSLTARILFGVPITDIMTGHKVFSRAVADSFDLKEDGFNIEVEIASQSLQNGWRFAEIPITYTYRNFGTSKIAFFDGITSLMKLLEDRLRPDRVLNYSVT